MLHYKLKLAYQGTGFLGWQKQKDFQPTVQGELESALKRIFKSEQILSVGAGRTDTGVHALGQIVKISVPFEIPSLQLLKALNSQLPMEIKVLQVEPCDETFRPTYDALKKKYCYFFTNSERPSPFQLNLVANCRYELDFEKMHDACRLFVGTHDFKNFSCTGSDPATTVRTIYSCELKVNIKANLGEILPSYHLVEIVGDGFLKQMVRLIVGTLWHVGRGKLSLEQVQDALKQTELDRRIGEVAPATGLYKAKTWY